MPHPVPTRLFEKIAAGVFTLMTCNYVLLVDYFLKFPFAFKLHDKTAYSVITLL